MHKSPLDRAESRREVFEVHNGRGQVGLDARVGKAASCCAAQSVLRLGSAVDTFDSPAVARVFFAGRIVPPFFFSPSCAQKCGVGLADEQGAGLDRG